jgi:hypothetical protein
MIKQRFQTRLLEGLQIFKIMWQLRIKATALNQPGINPKRALTLAG